MKNEKLTKADDLFNKLADNDVTKYVSYRIANYNKYPADLESYIESIDSSDKSKQDSSIVMRRVSGHYALIINGGHTIYITTSPTANCQFLSIGYFEKLLEHLKSKEQLAKILNYIITKITAKPMILVDVHQNYCGQVDLTFKDCVQMKSEFNSTNGSQRCIYLLNINKFLGR